MFSKIPAQRIEQNKIKEWVSTSDTSFQLLSDVIDFSFQQVKIYLRL